MFELVGSAGVYAPPRRLVIAFGMLTLAWSAVAQAQTPDQPPSSSTTPAHAHEASGDGQHQHQPGNQGEGPHEHGATGLPALCAICPAGREADGTSWQPDAAPSHQRVWTIGDWQAAAHVQVAVIATDESGPRGDDGTFTTNFVMFDARRRAGRGVFGVQTMWSLEPTIGRRGYPLLLQEGETADGVNALVDRQHPHDLPMELAVTYSRPFDVDRAVFVYAAAVGSPALGPPAFMHRASAAALPVSPITHHWFDSTHVSYGVLTAGVIISPTVKLEASAFRGREPDQHRWGFEKPGLDSYAFRLSINPTANLAVQVSGGLLHDVEQTHPGADLARLTASAMYSRRWNGLGLDALAAWGRNKRLATSFPVAGGIYLMPSSLAQAVLTEATIHLAPRHAVIGRFEHAEKDELFGIDDPRHAILFPVSRVTAGYMFDLLQTANGTVGVGAAWSSSRVDPTIQPAYGGSPRSLLAFVQITAH